VPLLKKIGETDVLLSGKNSALQLPFDIKYRVQGLGFAFGKRGGINYIKSIRQANVFQLLKDIRQLPVENYDVVISDFEPVSAWACKLKRLPCTAISHQASFLSNKTPRIENKDLITELIFKYYSPSTLAYGFHFKSYDQNIYTPVIRKDIRNLNPTDKNFYVVYLPAYADEYLRDFFKKYQDTCFKIFSISSKQHSRIGNVEIIPVNPVDFTKGFETCTGIITRGGFETPAEAFYLNKKMMYIPMRNQYEQACNAEALRHLGFTIVHKIDSNFSKHLDQWLANDYRYHEVYPDQTFEILQKAINAHLNPEAMLHAGFD
jgi:uncharacterized protein (TIGR00661 family)